MMIIRGVPNHAAMLQMYRVVMSGDEVEARGSRTKNVRDLAIVLDSNEPVITSFDARKLNLRYAKQEWLWYLRADPFDDSIEKHATMWAKIKQPDGRYFSNYGQYIFGRKAGSSQFDFVVRELTRDRYSRRASIVLLQREHLFAENKDVVCTYSINFGIVGDRLDMTVMMRSNDVIFGFTNDSFCFWSLHVLAYVLLQQVHPDLKLGSYAHFTNSMHVYERHYDMIAKIVDEGTRGYTYLTVPAPTVTEAVMFTSIGDYDGPGAYTAWLKS